MLKVCPRCKGMTVEYDYHHRVEKCLNKECGWVNRDKEALPDGANCALPSMKLSVSLEQQYLKKSMDHA